MIKTGKIIVFRVVTHNNKSALDRFCRQFYGYLDRSHHGQYQYQRKGLIENFPYIKPLRGVLVVKKNDANEIISFLQSYNADIYARDILLLEEDLNELDLK